ncbi:MAG: FAD binding domain-containing protein [Gammaproteobacteria bacterium]
MTRLWLNGRACSADDKPLLEFLRQQRQLHGTRGACHEGDCGSCQILLSDNPLDERPQFHAVTSCLLRTADLEQHHVVTIEGLQHLHSPATAHPLFQLLADAGASQCGFCSPGLVMALLNWLLNGTTLDTTEGERWINGNLCRCTGYMGQRRAVQHLVQRVAPSLRESPWRLGTLIDMQWLPAWMQFPDTGSADDHGLADDHDAETMPALPADTIGGGTDYWLEHDSAQACASVLAPSTECAAQVDNALLYLNARSPLQQVATTLQQLDQLPVFQSFTEAFASMPVRQRATLGGNLAHASPVADSIPLLLVLDAMVQTSQRTLSIHELFTGFKQTALQAGEIIEWLLIPLAEPDTSVQFDKVSRRPHTDIAVANAASYWRVRDDRVIEARIAIGGASPMPVRLFALENDLKNLPITSDITTLVKSRLQTAINPISDVRGSAQYRRLLARQLILAHWQQLQPTQERQHVRA